MKKKCMSCGFECSDEEYAVNAGMCDDCWDAKQMEEEYMENHPELFDDAE